MNLNAKELEKVRDVVVYLKIAIGSNSSAVYRFMTSVDQIKKEVLPVLKTVKQTAEAKYALEYLESALNSKDPDGWKRYLFIMNKENLGKEIIGRLEKIAKWNELDDKIISEKAISTFKRNLEAKTLEEQRDKIKEHAGKKKINKLWKIASAVAAGIAVGYGIKRTAHFIKRKPACRSGRNAKK